MNTRDEYWLGQQGRLIEPVHMPAGSDHCVPISWADAFALVADRLNALESTGIAIGQTLGVTVLDHDFLAEHTDGLVELREHLRDLDDAEVLVATGLSVEQIDHLAARYIGADRVIVTWVMASRSTATPSTPSRRWSTSSSLHGNIGRPGAGASPIRGHSNVQGDRTMVTWEQMADEFLDAVGTEFRFEPPREHGFDAIATLEGMQRGDIEIFVAMGGNFVGAISDTNAVEAAMRGTKLTVQISTQAEPLVRRDRRGSHHLAHARPDRD